VRTAFRHVTFKSRLIRYATWRAWQALGVLGRVFLSGRRKVFWLLAAAEAAALTADAVYDDKVRSNLVLVGVCAFLGWIVVVFVFLLVQARRRVVVEPFNDATGDVQKAEPRGLATLLVGEIAELRDLYSTVDERTIPTAVQSSRPLDATIKVEELSDFLDGPAMIEAKASIGPVQIPMGALLAFLGRFVRGPRLLGAVHVEGQLLVLAAQLSQQGALRTWRVERPIPANAAGGRAQVPHDMVEELAYRMFTDLALGGPVRWQATRQFAQALGAIRVCLRTPENRRQNLQEAERSLIEALKEDDQLGYVYYNLGVVFTELRRLAESERHASKRLRAEDEARNYWNAAERAFREQIELMPDRWEAYYALALTYKSRTPAPQWDYVLKRCDRVTAMKPSPATRAKALLVKSDANASIAGRDASRFAQVILDRQWAVAEAWAARCRSERIAGGEHTAEEQLAASALKELAVAYRDRRRRLAGMRARRADRVARRLLGRAVKLSPHDAEIWFERGRACASKPPRAIEYMDEALRIDPGRRAYWAELALLHARNAKRRWLEEHDRDAERRHAEYCAEQALHRVDCYAVDRPAKLTLRTLAKTYRELDQPVRAARVRAMREVARLCTAFDLAKATELRRLIRRHGDTDWAWAIAQEQVARGRAQLEKGDNARAERSFDGAVKALQQADCPDEIVWRELRIKRADALQQLKRYDEALEELRRAIGDDPLHSEPREKLADAFLEIRDYEQASQVLHHALLWDPDRAALHRKVAHCHWRLGADRRSASRRKRALRRALKSFVRAQELSGHHELQAQLESHYWIARLHKELGEYELAIPYLRRATICKQAEPLVHLLLGEAYVRAHAYDRADAELTHAIVGTTNMRPGIDYGRLFNDPGWEPARVHAEAYALQAFAYAERGVSLNDRAREAVRRGRGALESVRVNRHVAEAALDGAAGLIDLKDDKTPLDTAIKHFRNSLARVPASETYVLLARAYLLKIDEERAHAARWIRRGEDACRCAIELDVTERYSAQAKALRVEFAAAKERSTTVRPVVDAPTFVDDLQKGVALAADGRRKTDGVGGIPVRPEA